MEKELEEEQPQSELPALPETAGLRLSQEAAKDLEINESNFNQYFFDARLHGPHKGQVLASYTAVGECGDGPEKRQIIEFLRFTNKIEPALQIVRKVLMAKEGDVYRLVREIAEDLLSMNVEEVATKHYKFIFEMCFWTRPEYIPTGDPHWACVSIMNLEEHLRKAQSHSPLSAVN